MDVNVDVKGAASLLVTWKVRNKVYYAIKIPRHEWYFQFRQNCFRSLNLKNVSKMGFYYLSYIFFH